MKTYLLLFGCILISLSVFSQQTVPATGGDASGGSGSVSFTVGQIVYSSNSGSSGSENQGVQQPYEVSVITKTDDYPEIILDIVAFPNPTDGHLVLNTGSLSPENTFCRLSDLNGKLLQEIHLTDKKTNIQMFQYPAGIYLLQVSDNQSIIKVFKIIKH